MLSVEREKGQFINTQMKKLILEVALDVNQEVHLILTRMTLNTETIKSLQFKKHQEQFQLDEFQDRKKSSCWMTWLMLHDQEMR